MPAITLKKVPPDLFEEIKKSAEINLRSINNEILFRLKLAFSRKAFNPDAFIKRIEMMQSNLKLPKLTDEILEKAKNEGRA